MYARHPQRQYGFTLIELLVVFAIFGIITALLLQGFARYAYRQAHLQFVSEVHDELVEARTQTIASLGDTTYGMYIGANTIEFFSGSVPTPGDSANTIITIPAQTTVIPSFSSGLSYMTFERLTGAASTSGTIQIVDARSVATSVLTITAAGLVE